MADEIRLGKIVWVDATDPQGNPAGEHAVVILTSKNEYAAGEPIKGVVVSSKLGKTADDRKYEVLLPYLNGRRHPLTSFDKKCAAKCNWRLTVQEHHISRYGGFVGKKYLDKIIAIIEKSTQS